MINDIITIEKEVSNEQVAFRPTSIAKSIIIREFKRLRGSVKFKIMEVKIDFHLQTPFFINGMALPDEYTGLATITGKFKILKS